MQGRGITVKRPAIARGSRDPKAAAVGRQPVYVDRRKLQATVYDRTKLEGGQPHQGTRDRASRWTRRPWCCRSTRGLVDRLGNILIYPDGHKGLR